VRADDANVYLLRHDAATDEWTLQALDRSEQLPLSEEDKVKAQQSEPNRPGTTDLSQLLRGGLVVKSYCRNMRRSRQPNGLVLASQ